MKTTGLIYETQNNVHEDPITNNNRQTNKMKQKHGASGSNDGIKPQTPPDNNSSYTYNRGMNHNGKHPMSSPSPNKANRKKQPNKQQRPQAKLLPHPEAELLDEMKMEVDAGVDVDVETKKIDGEKKKIRGENSMIYSVLGCLTDDDCSSSSKKKKNKNKNGKQDDRDNNNNNNKGNSRNDPTLVWKQHNGNGNDDVPCCSYDELVSKFDTLEKNIPDIFRNRMNLMKFNSKYSDLEHSIKSELIDDYFFNLKSQSYTRRHPYLNDRSQLDSFKYMMESIYLRRKVLISFDIEAFEFDTRMITEVGISIYDPSNQTLSNVPSFKQIHIVINEFANYVNRRFVPNNKRMFLGGPSLNMDAVECSRFIQQLLHYYYDEIPKVDKSIEGCLLIGHGPGEDLKWFSMMGVVFPPGAELLDTQKFWQLSHGKHGGSLSRILRYMDIPHAYLHNAGNDCFYTLQLAMQLADPQIRMLKRLDEWNYAKNEEDEEAKKSMRMKDNVVDVVVKSAVEIAIEKEKKLLEKRKKEKARRERKAMVYDIVPSLDMKDANMALEYVFNQEHQPFTVSDPKSETRWGQNGQ